MPTASILVVEDDHKIAQVLIDYLQASGYQTAHCDDGTLALQRLRSEAFDLLLLDRMLPGMDGVALCVALRQFSTMPVIMLTAMIEEDDKLDGLEAGADDYVCKPFSPREVMARVKAQLRRSVLSAYPETSSPLFDINVGNMSITLQGQVLALTPVEYRLLAELIKHPSRVYSRQQLLNVASEDYRDSGDRTIDAHIKNIRKKIGSIKSTGTIAFADCLQSVYGVGYRFELPVSY
ncbi:response regulator [Undibacterium sp. Ji22W]|uniref:response regulator n=1 Tax=Undibacterium sp. Ji22W TaxID=3413038 RepID=UPI003BEFB1AD